MLKNTKFYHYHAFDVAYLMLSLWSKYKIGSGIRINDWTLIYNFCDSTFDDGTKQ